MSTEGRNPWGVDGGEGDGDKPPKKARYSCGNTEPCAGSSNLYDINENTACMCSQGKQLIASRNVIDKVHQTLVDRMRHFDVPLSMLNHEHLTRAAVPLNLRTNRVPNDDHFIESIPHLVAQGRCGDHFLLTWQARQMAKGFIDNTINGVLEQFRSSGSPVVDRGGDTVEDEGILMAIRSHGLRQESSNLDGLLESGSGATPLDSVVESKTNFASEKIDETDFLNTAVSVAISSKGLSSCSYE